MDSNFSKTTMLELRNISINSCLEREKYMSFLGLSTKIVCLRWHPRGGTLSMYAQHTYYGL